MNIITKATVNLLLTGGLLAATVITYFALETIQNTYTATHSNTASYYAQNHNWKQFAEMQSTLI